MGSVDSGGLKHVSGGKIRPINIGAASPAMMEFVESCDAIMTLARARAVS